MGRVVLLSPGDEEGMPDDDEGARSPLFGRLGAVSDLNSESVGMAPVLLRVLVFGKAGRAVCGGPKDGLEGRGIVAAIVNDSSRNVVKGWRG